MSPTYMLDTNTCIYALKGNYPAVAERLHTLSPDRIGIPAVVKAELLYGCEKSNRKAKCLEAAHAFLFPFSIVPFCTEAAERYSVLRATLERQGKPIGPNDLLIGATALAHGATLVTHNAREFSRIDELRLEDWTA